MQTLIIIGGIASGKSTALNCFKQLGIDCYSADEISRELVIKDAFCYHQILAKCGPACLNPDTSLNRDYLRQLLLKDRDFKHWLEELLHPLIRQTLIEKAKLNQKAYCVLEVPLLKCKDDYPNSKVLYIHTKLAKQKLFLKNRNLSDAEIESLLAIQIPANLSLKLADFVIENNGTLTDLAEKIKDIHQFMLKQKTP
jgi:dephospho-CoA kinase